MIVFAKTKGAKIMTNENLIATLRAAESLAKSCWDLIASLDHDLRPSDAQSHLSCVMRSVHLEIADLLETEEDRKYRQESESRLE